MNTIPHPEQKRNRAAEQLLAKLDALTLPPNPRNFKWSWREKLAEDLNYLLGRAEYHLETSADESDIAFASAVVRVVERVKEFEELR